eukprot:scaffold1518_cov417-Prasinococcus_capsulatus_cf.AAC.3
MQAILSASIAPEAKPYLALGAWGNRGGPTLYSPESYELDSFIRSVQAVEEAQSGDADCEDPRANTFVEHRMLDAREVSHISQLDGLLRPLIPPPCRCDHQYYFELAKYKFLVAPHGNGIQSPKFLEALMVRHRLIYSRARGLPSCSRRPSCPGVDDSRYQALRLFRAAAAVRLSHCAGR